MAWTTISDFTDEQVISATIMNQLADNIEFLANTTQGDSEVTTEQTTTSATFVSIGASFEKTISMTGGNLLVLLTGMTRVTGVGTEVGYFDIELDAARLGHTTEGLMVVQRETNAGTVTGTPPYSMIFGRIITGLSVASHTIKIMWMVDSGGTFRLGYSGTAIRLYVKEI